MKRGFVVILVVLALLTLLSLAANGVVVFGLLRARDIALDAVTDARQQVKSLGRDTIAYTFELDQEIPIAATVPVEEEVIVPINTSVPISTSVTVPVNTGVLGTYNIDVPVQTVIPVDLQFDVPVSQTVDISTTVRLQTEVPIRIPIDETPLAEYLDDLDNSLGSLERRLRRPLRGGEIEIRTTDE